MSVTKIYVVKSFRISQTIRGFKMSDPKGFPSLKASLDSVSPTTYKALSARAESKVAHEEALEDMKTHILKLYDKIEAEHSFMDETGAIYDCIPIEQQPSLKGKRPPEAPDAPPAAGGQYEARKDSFVGSPLGPDRKDRHGNAMQCPAETVPMRRVTLEDLSRFKTLQDFFRKGPGGAGLHPRAGNPRVLVWPRWAQAYQFVPNAGGSSTLNIWDPPIGGNHVVSCSQHSYEGRSGGALQVIECGWHVFPARYGDTRPHLFTYWTADGCNQTGCYNLQCPAFVQTGSTFAPGMALETSVIGGAMKVITLAYWHTGGRWWLYVNGTAASNAIGYYPDTIFEGGTLAGNASEIYYGGEVLGTTSFPPMGSGRFAKERYGKAAYQRSIHYYPPQGGAAVVAELTAEQDWPSCYTAEFVQYQEAPWMATLWFGGPGGNC
jgi:hypothetical protein